ncbi:MAG: hypothetical protein U1E65_15115 [Myxococcota bacterium]
MRPLLVLTVGLAACGLPSKAVVGYPKLDGVQTYLLLVGADATEGRVLTVDDPFAQEAAADAQVTVFAFAETLDTLGLSAGPVRLASGDGLGRPFPHPLKVFALRVDVDTRTASWEETTVSPPKIYIDPMECATWDLSGGGGRGIDLSDGLPYSAVVGVDAQQILLANATGLRIVTADTVTNAPLPSSEGVYGAFATNGVLVYSDGTGAIFQGRVDSTGIKNPIKVAQLPGFGPASQLVGTAAGGGLEMYAVQGLGALYFGQGQWQVLGRLTLDAGEHLLYVPDHTAYLATAEVSKIYHLTPTALESEPIGTSVTQVTSLALDVDGAPLAGTYTSEIYRKGPAGWERKLDSGTGYWVIALAPYEDGIMMELASGGVQQWRPAVGLCPEIFPSGASEGGNLLPLGGGFMAFSTGANNRSYIAHYLRRK